MYKTCKFACRHYNSCMVTFSVLHEGTDVCHHTLWDRADPGGRYNGKKTADIWYMQGSVAKLRIRDFVIFYLLSSFVLKTTYFCNIRIDMCIFVSHDFFIFFFFFYVYCP